MAKKILAINGGYRRGGITAQAVAEAAAAAREAGADVELIELADMHVEFCTNCRACTQAPGARRGECVIKDEMGAILDRADAADGLILAAPVNFYNVTALMRRFIERLVCYAYWPWGAPAPKLRAGGPSKKAVLITSTAMPAFAGRIFTGAVRALGAAAEAMGARKTGTLFVGACSMEEKPALREADRLRARHLGRRLAA